MQLVKRGAQAPLTLLMSYLSEYSTIFNFSRSEDTMFLLPSEYFTFSHYNGFVTAFDGLHNNILTICLTQLWTSLIPRLPKFSPIRSFHGRRLCTEFEGNGKIFLEPNL